MSLRGFFIIKKRNTNDNSVINIVCVREREGLDREGRGETEERGERGRK